jgi:hypothetical protein
VGHRPSTSRKMGLFLKIPYQKDNHVFMKRIIAEKKRNGKGEFRSLS